MKKVPLYKLRDEFNKFIQLNLSKEAALDSLFFFFFLPFLCRVSSFASDFARGVDLLHLFAWFSLDLELRRSCDFSS